MPPRLKVFQAQFGFYDSVVAVASRAAALEAWGAHQNLFHGGGAYPSTDAAAIEAALAHPGVPLRRAIGSQAPFSLDPGAPTLPGLPDGGPARAKRKAEAPRSPARTPRPAPAAAPKRKPVPPDRGPLDTAEASLRSLEETHRHEIAALDRRRADLDAEASAAERRFTAAVGKARAQVKAEARRFERASAAATVPSAPRRP